MMRPRVFSIGEVNALIPKLSELVEDQRERYHQIEQRVTRLLALKDISSGTLVLLDEPGDTQQIRTLKSELKEHVLRYEAGWKEVESYGAVVKDQRLGLLDFYGRIDGRLVWLCWQSGETALRYYHELGKGFGARQLISDETSRYLLN